MKSTSQDLLNSFMHARAGKPSVVDMPSLRFLMVDGEGDPNGNPAFSNAVEALYAVSYCAKFSLKKQGGGAFKVAPLEGLWWSATGRNYLLSGLDKSDFMWTVMIRQPGEVSPKVFRDSVREALTKKENPALATVRFEKFAEGRSAQVLHLGPYSAEGPTIALLHEFIVQQGGTPAGKHHEIYLGDPRRAKPEKLKTIIRQPFAKK